MWRSYNSENYDTEVINNLFQKPHKSFAVMGGHISGGLEILDVDLKNSRDPDNLWRDLLTNIEEALPDFAKKCNYRADGIRRVSYILLMLSDRRQQGVS